MSHSNHHGHGEHAHHVTSMFTLVGVLAVLCALTVLTFLAYFVEIWITEAFGVYIPQWVNVVIAMSIALVKGTLVLLYFMHLRHDDQLNTVVFMSCIAAFMIFIGFTALDLGNQRIDRLVHRGSANILVADNALVIQDIDCRPATHAPGF